MCTALNTAVSFACAINTRKRLTLLTLVKYFDQKFCRVDISQYKLKKSVTELKISYKAQIALRGDGYLPFFL